MALKIQSPMHSESGTVYPVSEGDEIVATVRLWSQWDTGCNVFRVVGINSGKFRMQRVFPVVEPMDDSSYWVPESLLRTTTRELEGV